MQFKIQFVSRFNIFFLSCILYLSLNYYRKLMEKMFW